MLGLVKLVCSRQSLRLSTKTFSVSVVSLRHAGTPYRKVTVGADSLHVSFRFLASPKALKTQYCLKSIKTWYPGFS